MKMPAMQLSLFETRSSSDRFAVRVSARARRLTARVHVGGRVEIVVPRGVGPRTVRDFVQRFTPWIDRKVAAMGPGESVFEPVPAEISFALTGERFGVQWQRAERRRIRIRETQLLLEAPDERGARRLLRSWLRRAAAERLSPRLMGVARDLRHQVAKVAIRCQRTRWGSCSSRGTLSLNCSLLFLREAVVRYLFVHELTHLHHMNHSARFWHAVEAHEPDFKRLDAELLDGWRTVPGWVFSD
ncbi:MAG: M48 family metallopeptidase [Steroidobacterales bacterium]